MHSVKLNMIILCSILANISCSTSGTMIRLANIERVINGEQSVQGQVSGTSKELSDIWSLCARVKECKNLFWKQIRKNVMLPFFYSVKKNQNTNWSLSKRKMYKYSFLDAIWGR